MDLTKKQTLILWALLVRPGGKALSKDLKPTVDKADRDALLRAGLVGESKAGRAIALEVTDRGWGWAADHLDADLPGNSPAGSQILQGWLKLLKSFLAASDLPLADFVLARPAAKGAPPAPPADVSKIEGQIRAAYLDASGGAFNQRVWLSALRGRLRGVGDAALDEALRRLHLSGGAHLSGSDNPYELSEADRAAKLEFKGETKYALWIER